MQQAVVGLSTELRSHGETGAGGSSPQAYSLREKAEAAGCAPVLATLGISSRAQRAASDVLCGHCNVRMDPPDALTKQRPFELYCLHKYLRLLRDRLAAT
jgi:hypothetical protein